MDATSIFPMNAESLNRYGCLPDCEVDALLNPKPMAPVAGVAPQQLVLATDEISRNHRFQEEKEKAPAFKQEGRSDLNDLLNIAIILIATMFSSIKADDALATLMLLNNLSDQLSDGTREKLESIVGNFTSASQTVEREFDNLKVGMAPDFQSNSPDWSDLFNTTFHDQSTRQQQDCLTWMLGTLESVSGEPIAGESSSLFSSHPTKIDGEENRSASDGSTPQPNVQTQVAREISANFNRGQVLSTRSANDISHDSTDNPEAAPTEKQTDSLPAANTERITISGDSPKAPADAANTEKQTDSMPAANAERVTTGGDSPKAPADAANVAPSNADTSLNDSPLAIATETDIQGLLPNPGEGERTIGDAPTTPEGEDFLFPIDGDGAKKDDTAEPQKLEPLKPVAGEVSDKTPTGDRSAGEAAKDPLLGSNSENPLAGSSLSKEEIESAETMGSGSAVSETVFSDSLSRGFSQSDVSLPEISGKISDAAIGATTSALPQFQDANNLVWLAAAQVLPIPEPQATLLL